MSDDIQKADQIAFHFYTKLFYAVHDARATEGARPQAKVDKWFNLDTPDCDLFTRDAREPYRSISLASSLGPPPLEIEVLLAVPDLASNQVLVYAPPDATRVKVDPARSFILLETWTLSMELYRNGRAPEVGADVALPTIYKHGIVLFRSLYSLLRVLPAWKFYKRLKRRTGGVNRNGNLAIQLRVRPQGSQLADADVLRFGVPPAPAHSPLPTQTHAFAAIPHLLGTFSLRTEYLAAPHFFQLDEREALLSSGFLSFDRHTDGQKGFVPTLERHKHRDSISGSNLNAPVASSPPRAVALGRASSTGSTGGNASGGGIKDNNTSLAERFLIPSRVASVGIGPSASTGSSALIPPPRPFPTMASGNTTVTNTVTNTNTNINTNNPTPASGLAMHRLRRESLNSSTSSSASARDPIASSNRPNTSTPSPTTIPLPNPGTTPGTTSLSSSPSSGVPIRRPGINPVHPFKSNTLSSAGGSSPSMSIRQGIAGSPAGMGLGMPSSLGREVNIGLTGGSHSRHTSFSSSGMQHSPVIPGARLPPLVTAATNINTATGTGNAWPSPPGHATTFAPSSLGAPATDRFGGPGGRGMSVERDSEHGRERDRRRSVQGVYGASGGGPESGAGSADGGKGQPVPVPMQPRRRFESSFGHRYTGSAGGSAGSGTSGGGGAGASPNLVAGAAGGRVASTQGSVPGSVEGSGPSGRGTPGSSREVSGARTSPQTSTDAADEDKEISIFVQDIDDRKPLSGRTKEHESSTRAERRYSQHARDATEATLKGKGRAYDVSSPVDPTALYTTSLGPLSPTSPRASDDPAATTADPDSPSAATSPTTMAEAVAYLSTSPQRGPMLTSKHEIDERLRQMNETFMRSLEGISDGSVRRKKGKDPASNISSTKHDTGERNIPQTSATASAITTESRRSSSLRSTSGSSSTATATHTVAPPSPTSPRSPGPVNIPAGSRLGSAFPARGALAERDAHAYAPGLGLGLPARARRASTSSSTFGASEVGASQGSEEVIGRMELDGDRRRWGYGYAPP